MEGLSDSVWIVGHFMVNSGHKAIEFSYSNKPLAAGFAAEGRATEMSITSIWKNFFRLGV